MSIVQNGFVDVPSDFQTELDRTKEKLKLCIIKKEKEYVVLWNNWCTKCEERKFDKILYDKAYNDMQQKFERLQAQLRDLKGKSSDTPSASNTLDPLNQKLESKIVELKFQVVNYEREISHLKTTYKNLFDSIASNQAHAKLHNLVYENTKLRARLFENTFEPMNNTSGTSVTPHVDKPKLSVVTSQSKKLHASMSLHSVPQPKEFNVVKHRNLIAPGMFKINPSQTARVDLVPNKQSSANIRTNPITNSQRHVTFKENVSSGTVTTSFIGLVHTARTRRPQPKGNSRNARILSASKSSEVKKNNDKSKIVCDNCKQCLVTANHDACLPSSMNALNSHANKLCANVPPSANQKRHRTHVWKPKQVGSKERLAPKPRLPRFSLKWSPSGHSFDLKGKLVASKETNCPNDDKACTSNPQEPMRKQFLNSTVFLGRLSKFVCGASTQVVPSIWPRTSSLSSTLCGSFWELYTLETTTLLLFWDMVILNGEILQLPRRNTCFIRDLDGVDLLKGNCSTNLYTINLYDMASASPICLMAHVHFLRTKDETPEVIKNFLKKIYVRLQAPIIIVRTDNGTESKNQVLKDYFYSVGIIHETFVAKTPQQNGFIEHRNRTLVEAARTIVYNRRTKKIMETINVTFDELSAMDFEQNSSRPGLQSMTFGQISSKLELTYAPSTITPQRPSERDLDILFEPLHNEYLGDSTPVPTNSLNTPFSSHNVDATSQQHAQQQRNLTPSPTASATDNVLNAVFEGGLFVNLFATPSTESVVSSTQYVDPSNMNTFYQPYPHDYQWTKDHPLDQVIEEPSRMDYGTKSVKEALNDHAWIESMQEELHQFIRLDVWELVPSPDGIKPLTLKWLFKNKHDEENTVIRNKTRLVVRGYRQDHVYKLKKKLYGLKQAPRAWYDELSTFLLQNRFSKGTIDLTLFTRHFDDDILVVNQSPSGIFINQSNYVNEILKKYGLNTCDLIGTPMDIKDKVDLDQIATPVDATKYHSMIGALMYLMSSRPDIVHATCDSGFELTGFSDADYAGYKDTFKSTSSGAHFLVEILMALWIHCTVLDRPTVTSYGDIRRDDGNPSRANIKQALERFNTSAGNHVKEILLKLNLPDHWSILTDSKAIVLRHKVAMLSMRVKRFYKKTGRNLEFNGKEPVGFDKIKVECFNYHRRRHFARDCRSAMNSKNKSRDAGNAGYRGRDNGKRPAKKEDEKALVVQDGLGTYDCSYQVEEEGTNFALMAFTSNPSSSSSSNSEEEVTETVFDNRSSDEENSLANDRFKKGGGYHVVPLPLTRNYMPPKSDLLFAGLDDSIYKYKISEIVTSLTKDEKYAPETSTACVEKPKEDRSSAPLIQDWDSDSDNDSVFYLNIILLRLIL
nr:hypothetical protein [Tanacetum cinerariifolium]